MKEITKTYQLYKFDELDEKIQEELLKQETEKQANYFCDYELQIFMEQKAKELLHKYFKNNATYKQVYYDLSYSQGDGAMIEFDLQYYKNNFEIRQYGHYYHERAFTVINKNWYKELSPKVLSKLDEKIVNMNKELVKYGYNLIEDEEYFRSIAKECLLENDENYLKDGKIFNF